MRRKVARLIRSAAHHMAGKPLPEDLRGVALSNPRTSRTRQLKREWNATPRKERRAFRAALVEAIETTRKA